MDQQADLPLPYPASAAEADFLPARMVNEYQYCPRLAYLEWVQAEFADSADVVQGRHSHHRVDQPGGRLPTAEAAQEDEHFHARSITLASPRLGLIAKLDLLEGDGRRVTPVDYKRGKRPHVAKGAYDPERVQVCVQGLLLREHGYDCDEGLLYFAESRERVKVLFDDELLALTQNAVDGLRLIAAAGHIPPPLEDSPKCPRCSLAGICLPDEVNFLRRGGEGETLPRPLAVSRETALPLYVQARGGKVSKSGDTLEVWVDDAKAATARIDEVSQLVLQGNVYLTAPAMQELMSRNIPVTWTSHGGWFYGHTMGLGHKNVELRTAQYRVSFDERACRELARGIVAAKIRNQRTLLRRNWKDGELPETLLAEFRHDIEQAEHAASLAQLLGVEGNAAARYFRHFNHMLRQPGSPTGTAGKDDPDDGEAFDTPAAGQGKTGGATMEAWVFDFNKRNRRPPTDPVNALLSYAYSLLVKQFNVSLSAVGFDPFRGFYHQPRYGRPALSLDLMEPFRPLIADSCVIQAINNGEIRAKDFIRVGNAAALTPDGRKAFIAAFERRLSHQVTHPLFGYSLPYRSLIELQARLLGRHLQGEIDHYPNFITR